MTDTPAPLDELRMRDRDEILDEVSDALSLENWFEGKTLTVVLRDKSGENIYAKFRLVGTTNKPSSADLRGEPE